MSLLHATIQELERRDKAIIHLRQAIDLYQEIPEDHLTDVEVKVLSLLKGEEGARIMWSIEDSSNKTSILNYLSKIETKERETALELVQVIEKLQKCYGVAGIKVILADILENEKGGFELLKIVKTTLLKFKCLSLS